VSGQFILRRLCAAGEAFALFNAKTHYENDLHFSTAALESFIFFRAVGFSC